MGTARKAATTPFKSKPSLTSIVRLDISVWIIEALSQSYPLTHLHSVGPQLLDVARRAMPQRRRSLARTWHGQARRRASRVRQTPAVPRLHWCEDPDR